MPLVTPRIHRFWLPTDSRCTAGTHSFTARVLSFLPQAVAQVVNEVDGARHKTADVAIFPEVQHNWARNVSEFFFLVQPGAGGRETPIEHAKRRAAIDDSLGQKLAELFDTIASYVEVHQTPPRFDVEIETLGTFSGSTWHMGIGGMYQRWNQWGRREFA